MKNGADLLLVACSELSIIADAIPSSFPCIDTIDVLAEEVIEFAGADLHSLNAGGAAWRMSA